MPEIKKQNLTLSLPVAMIRKAKVLAAKRSTSVSGLLADQIERLIGADEAYERSHKAAVEMMRRGFHLGGVHDFDRNILHER